MIDDEDGQRRPVKDLVAPGRFLLVAGEEGRAWCDAARQLAAEAGIPPRTALAAALGQILARPVGAPVASAV